MEVRQILHLLECHERRRWSSLNLVASENVLSPAARHAVGHDMGQRYCIPPVGRRPESIWDYPNQNGVREVQRLAEELACEVFGAQSADVRPLSGNNAATIMLSALAGAGDTIATVPAGCGGHFATEAICARAGVRRVDLPYDAAVGRVDVEAAVRLCSRARVRLVFLDASMQVFPHPVRELRAALPPGTVLVYDASHTMGIIAGGRFQAPLAEGADILQGSTHKSLFGPQKALFAFGEDTEAGRSVYDAVCPLFVSNPHPHHTAALAVALAEARDFGSEYADAVVANARVLASSLHTAGAHIPFADAGFTDCHQFVWVIGEHGEAERAWRRLESAGLHTNLVRAPFLPSRYGVRIGVAELTRRGMTTREMTRIADLMHGAVTATAGGSLIARDVADLSRAHPCVHFGYDRDGNPTSPASPSPVPATPTT